MADIQDMIIKRCDEIVQEEHRTTDLYTLPKDTQERIWIKAGEDVAEMLTTQAENDKDVRENR